MKSGVMSNAFVLKHLLPNHREICLSLVIAAIVAVAPL